MSIENKKLRILIATGIFPPDIGGPATFAKILYNELPKFGCEVKVLTYSDEKFSIFNFQFSNKSKIQNSKQHIYRINRKQNKLIRYFKYFLQVWQLAHWADIIYAFDIISVGLPCAVVKLFRPKIKLVIRLGGDFQWEQAVQRGLCQNTLEQYYFEKKFGLREKVIYFITSFVMRQADKLIFNATFLRDIYINKRGINKNKTFIIKNIKPEIDRHEFKIEQKDHVNLFFAGRIIAPRNLINLIKAFNKVKDDWQNNKIILEIAGEGPEKEKINSYIKKKNINNYVKLSPCLDRAALLNKISNSDLIVLPSLTEVNSNFITEALALGKPVILTKHNELYYLQKQNDFIYYIDPLDQRDIIRKLRSALTRHLAGQTPRAETGYQTLEKEIYRSLSEVTHKHLDIFTALLN